MLMVPARPLAAAHREGVPLAEVPQEVAHQEVAPLVAVLQVTVLQAVVLQAVVPQVGGHQDSLDYLVYL